jgi:hypothetical protein
MPYEQFSDGEHIALNMSHSIHIKYLHALNAGHLNLFGECLRNSYGML